MTLTLVPTQKPLNPRELIFIEFLNDGTAIQKFWAMVPIGESENGCSEWLGYRLPFGYGLLKFRRANLYAHRVAWMLANGPIPEGLKVCHHCDNPPCVNATHLFAATQLENMKDMVRKGRHVPISLKGESNPWARFTEEMIRSIRADPRRQIDIAAEHRTTQSQISRIKLRQSWRHVH